MKTNDWRTAFAVVGIAAVTALPLLALVYTSLTIYYTAVRAARNDRAVNGIISELGGRRAWTDGSYINDQDASVWELELRTIELLQVLHANGLTKIRDWPETPRSVTWSTGGQEEISDLEFSDDLWLADEITIGDITIHGSGEVDYPGDVSEAAKEFWEAVIEAFPDIDWGAKEE